jgi:predicted  nucleic acid-binding Zn-ribbon protein
VTDDLRRLVRLQEILAASEELAERIAGIPAEVARLEKDLLAAEERLEKGRAGLQDLQKERRKLEMELMGIESKIAKYQTQLLEVKTNKEYQAMLKEIETCRAERAACDEKILLDMEAGEQRGRELRAREEALTQQRRDTAEAKTRLDGLLHQLHRETEALREERRKVEESITPGHLDSFLKVARQRKGLALVAVRDGLCGGCHVRVMPKLVQQVRRATGLIACDSCKRFLYVPEEPAGGGSAPADSPEP